MRQRMIIALCRAVRLYYCTGYCYLTITQVDRDELYVRILR